MKKPLTAVAVFVLLSCTPADVKVTSAEYGASWPFTIAEGRLQCQTDGPRKLVTLSTSKGIDYALNGSAKTFGFPDSASILKPGLTGIHLQPFIDRALPLCGKP